MTAPLPGPPPGWYPDPAGSGALRWWDGAQWSAALASAPPVVPPPGPLWVVDDELRVAPWAQRAFVVYGAVALVELLVALAFAAELRSELHQVRMVFHDAAHGLPAPTTTPALSGGYRLAAGLLGLASIGAIVTLLVWQYRAARVARALGYPARHTPGWGVGFWFVPVVNLWFPYQAIVDCLPPGHPSRPLVLRLWLALLGLYLVGQAAQFTLLYWRPVGIALTGVLAVLAVLYTLAGIGVVAAISAAHRMV